MCVHSKLPRSSFFVTTKVPCCPSAAFLVAAGGTPAACQPLGHNTTAQINHDMTMLGLDSVDLLLLHWPCDTFNETLAAYRVMEAAVAAGKARAIGVSNFNASLVDQLVAAAKIKPAINQCGYSIAGHSSGRWGRDDATVAACKKHGGRTAGNRTRVPRMGTMLHPCFATTAVVNVTMFTQAVVHV